MILFILYESLWIYDRHGGSTNTENGPSGRIGHMRSFLKIVNPLFWRKNPEKGFKFFRFLLKEL